MDKYGQVWTSMDKYGQVWTSMDTYGQVWTSMDKYGQVWTSMDKYGQVWTINYGQLMVHCTVWVQYTLDIQGNTWMHNAHGCVHACTNTNAHGTYVARMKTMHVLQPSFTKKTILNIINETPWRTVFTGPCIKRKTTHKLGSVFGTEPQFTLTLLKCVVSAYNCYKARYSVGLR